MYPSLKKDLSEFIEILNTNAEADWSENDPGIEFKALATKLEEIVNQNRERETAIENLSHYITGEDSEGVSRDLGELLDLLIAQKEIDGEVPADDIVIMWDKLEEQYTVNELLDLIGY